MGRSCSQEHGERYAQALAGYYEYARDNDLYLTYAIISPQADRSKGPGEQADEFVAAGVVDEDGRHYDQGREDARDRLSDGERGDGCIHPAAQAGGRKIQLYGDGAVG